MILTLTVAILSFVGIVITGLYPGIIVLLLLPLVPIASKFYTKKIIGMSNYFQKSYYTTAALSICYPSL